MASVISTEPTFKFRERGCTAITALYEVRTGKGGFTKESACT